MQLRSSIIPSHSFCVVKSTNPLVIDALIIHDRLTGSPFDRALLILLKAASVDVLIFSLAAYSIYDSVLIRLDFVISPILTINSSYVFLTFSSEKPAI